MITIVKPHFYWPETTLKMMPFLMSHIERCGRICYRSEDKITNDSAKRFVEKITKSGHHSVLEHFSITAIVICSRACSHQLVRHRIGSYCLAGDTKVVAFIIEKGRGCKRWTLEQLYEWSKDVKRKSRLHLIRLRSVNENGILAAGRIKKIINSGEQEVFRITTEFGRTIEATLKHRFLTPNGWKELGQLKVWDKLVGNGIAAHKNQEWILEMYIKRNLPRKEVAKLAGVSDACIGSWIRYFELQKPCGMRGNRKPGHGKKGMFSPEALKLLSGSKKGENNPGWKGDQASQQAGRQRARKHIEVPENCETCGSDTKIIRHHYDENALNNDPINIMFLCEKCHAQFHIGQTVMSVFSDRILFIEPVGVKQTYDIEMDGPNHNFVANGLVVHNSQESMRYCNYGKDDSLKVICPPSIGLEPGDYEEGFGLPIQQEIWIDQIDLSYQEYLSELAEGVRPEDARYVLPNATKTELAVTFNVRQWKHFFKMRCDKHAQWEIRGIAISIQDDLKSRFPSVFGEEA